MTRAEHRLVQGQCVRCGCGAGGNDGRCPPGFWMSSAEAERWSFAGSEANRERMEIELGSQQASTDK